MENALFALDHARFMQPLREHLEQDRPDLALRHCQQFPAPFLQKVYQTFAADWIVHHETPIVEVLLDAGVPVDTLLNPPGAGFRTLWTSPPSALAVAALTCQHDFAIRLIHRGASLSPTQLGTLRENMGTGLVELVKNHVDLLEKTRRLSLPDHQARAVADQVDHWKSRLGQLSVDPGYEAVWHLIGELHGRMDAVCRPSVPRACS